MGKNDGKPKGRMTSYACFVKACRDEHNKKHPNQKVDFKEFSQKCSGKWKTMGKSEKQRFIDMADADKKRYEKQMANYVPPAGGAGKKRKKTKDPNAPKRAMSAFFFFCAEHRAKVKQENPKFGVGDIAKVLGQKWAAVGDKSKWDKLAADDKIRYERAKDAYGKKAKTSPAKAASKKKPVQEEEDDEDEDEDDEDEEEEDEDEDEDEDSDDE